MENKNKLGLPSVVLYGINCVVGSGIFLLPGNAYKLMGTPILAVYVFLILIVMALALCFAEAGSMFGRSGGAYVYAKEAYGNFAGFEVGFMRWCIGMIAWATMAVALSTALSSVWPAASQPFVQKAIAISIIAVLSIVNLIGIDLVKWFNNLSTVGKMIPLVIVIAMGIFFIKGSNFTQSLDVELNIKSASQAAILIFYAFTGFENISIPAGDMENPQKNIPKATIISLVLISAIYFLIQTICIGILGTDLAESATPFADAATVMFGNVGMVIVTAGTVISIIGINVANSFAAPKLPVALAEDGLCPKVLAKKDSRGIPVMAIIVTGTLTILLTLTGSFVQLAVIGTIGRLIGQYIPTCFSVLKLRTRKDLTAGYHAPFGPVLPVFGIVLSVFLITQATGQQLLWGFGAAVVGAVIYGMMHVLAKEK